MRTPGTDETRAVRRRTHPFNATRSRLPVGLAAGLVAGLIVGLRFSVAFGVLSGWLTGALVVDIWIWLGIWHLDAAGTRSHLNLDDPGRRVGDAMLVACSVASLGAIGYLLLQRAPTTRLVVVQALLCVVTVALAWITVHTVYAIRYARLYYSDPEGGIEFHQREPPRRLALQQGLISYLLGAVVIGATINLIVSLPG